MKHSLVIAAALAVLLAACGKEEQPAVPTAPAEQAAPAAEAPAVVEAPATEAPATEPAAPAEGAPAPSSSEVPATAPSQGQSGAADMAAGMALAKSSGCLACHQIEAKRVGPSWMDVSKKYQGNADAKKMLAEWVHKGGTGRWGSGVMPPYSPRVPDADIEKLVDFILALNKG